MRLKADLPIFCQIGFGKADGRFLQKSAFSDFPILYHGIVTEKSSAHREIGKSR